MSLSRERPRVIGAAAGEKDSSQQHVEPATRASLRIGKATAGKKVRLRVTGKQYTTRKSALSPYTKKVKR